MYTERVTQPWALQDFKADLFRTLGNPVRIRILEELRAAGTLSVTEIQQAVGIEPSNASQHLGVLRTRGVVVAARDGTTVRYTVADEAIFALLDTARTVFESRLEVQRDALNGGAAR